MTTRSEHPGEDTLLAYAESTLSDAEQQSVEEHVAECAGCARLARQSFRFTQLADLSAEEHGDFVRRAAMENGLSLAEAGAGPDLEERLAEWRTRWAGLAEAAASVALSAVDRGTRVVADGVAGLTRPGSGWQLASATAGAIRGDASPHDSALLSTPVLATGERARLAVLGGDEPEVTVRIDGIRGDRRPLVLLVSIDGAQPPRLETAERAAGADYLLARFDAIPIGTYLVAIEPFDDDEREGGTS